MNDYPSVDAMKAAVELEIQACIGRIQTVGIGQLIQGVLDKQREDCAKIAESVADDEYTNVHRVIAERIRKSR